MVAIVTTEARQPKPRLTLDQVRTALISNRLNMAQCARSLGVSRAALYKWLRKYPELVEYRNELREEIIDECEAQLFKAVRRGARWAIVFVLTRLGRHRGWGPTTAVSIHQPGIVIIQASDATEVTS